MLFSSTSFPYRKDNTRRRTCQRKKPSSPKTPNEFFFYLAFDKERRSTPDDEEENNPGGQLDGIGNERTEGDDDDDEETLEIHGQHTRVKLPTRFGRRGDVGKCDGDPANNGPIVPEMARRPSSLDSRRFPIHPVIIIRPEGGKEFRTRKGPF